jgi:hypothetical protein
MNSLFDLNNFGETSITITDARFATVIFDRMTPLQPLDQSKVITTTTVDVDPGIEITDIINYSTADVRYIVEIKSKNNALTDTSLSWPTLPSYMSVSNTGLVYTVTGFRSASDWQAARSFTWDLPANFSSYPKWWLESKITYFDEELDQDVTKDWLTFDLKYYEVADLQVVASMSPVYKRVRRFQSALTSSFSQITDEGLEKQGRAYLFSNFNLTASALDAGLFAAFTQTANIKRSRNYSFAGSTAFTQVTNSAVYKAINLMTNRSYTSNAKNIIFTGFGQQAPYIEEPVGTSATYEVTLTSAQGEWGTTADDYTAASSITFTGTKEEVNDWFETVTWYPVKDITGTISATYTQKKNSVLQITKNFNLEYAASGSITPQLYTFTSNATWTPTVVERKYTVMDYLIVGAGEDGVGYGDGNFATGRGGRGGRVISATGATISNSSYSVVVGSPVVSGGTGGNSSFNSETAQGAYSGGFANGTDASLAGRIAYGGGSGAGGAGQNGTITGTGPYTVDGGDGGSGVANSITGTSRFYGPGGGGGFSVSSTDTASRGTNGTGVPTLRYGAGGQGQSLRSPNTYGGGEPGGPGVVYVKTR